MADDQVEQHATPQRLASPEGLPVGRDHRPRRHRSQLPSPVPVHAGDAVLTEERAEAMRQVLARRCGRLAVVLEDCFDPHNATAVLRSCDCFGILRVEVVAARNAFRVNREVSKGAHRWLDLRIRDSIDDAVAALRADGFELWVSDLHAEAVQGPQGLAARLAQRPLALVFGSEGFGVSARASELADGFFCIPMAGMTQSLNLSVTVAVSLYALRGADLAADAAGDLSPAQQSALYDTWLRDQHPQAVARLAPAIETGRQGEAIEVYGAGQQPA